MISLALRILLVVMALETAPAFSREVDSTAEEIFNQAMRAYQVSDFENAARLFEQARHEGITHPKLFYNLGSTMYRLERLDESYKFFLLSSQDKQLAAYSYYNLALIEFKTGNPTDAKRWIDKTRHNTDDPTLFKLIRRAEQRYLEKNIVTNRKLPSLAITMSSDIGYDNNVVIYNYGTYTPNAQIQDQYHTLNALGEFPLTAELQLATQLYWLNYLNKNEYDAVESDVRLLHRKKFGSLDLQGHIGATNLFLDQRMFQNALTAGYELKRKLHTDIAGLVTYKATRYFVNERAYAHLDGHSQTVDLQVLYSTAHLNVRLSGGIESQSRKDLSREDKTESFSPLAKNLGVALETGVTKKAIMHLYTRYTVSDFRTENSLGNLRFVRRDTKSQAGLDALYSYSKRITFRQSLDYTLNMSNTKSYWFENTRAAMGMIWKF